MHRHCHKQCEPRDAPRRRDAHSQVPEALWLTWWEAAWNVISTLLPLAYLWSLPLLARAGFCQGPAQ